MYVTPIIPKPTQQMNSTMNGFKKGMTGGKPQQLEARIGIGAPHSNKNKNSPLVDFSTAGSRQSNEGHDPFTKINPRARKLVESVERRVGSTGGTGGSST
jgi:hypothetical protein